MDRPRPVPARPELLHHPARPRGNPARGVRRLAAQRDAGRAARRDAVRAAGRHRPVRALRGVRRLRHHHGGHGAVRRDRSGRAVDRGAGPGPAGPSCHPSPVPGGGRGAGVRSPGAVRGAVPRRGARRGPDRLVARVGPPRCADGTGRGRRRGSRAARPRRRPARRPPQPRADRPGALPRAGRVVAARAGRGRHHRSRQHPHDRGPLLLGHRTRDLRWRVRRALLRRAARGRVLRLAGAGGDGPRPRPRRDHSWSAHHGAAVRRLPRCLPRPRWARPVGGGHARRPAHDVGDVRARHAAGVPRGAVRRAAAQQPGRRRRAAGRHRRGGRGDREPRAVLRPAHTVRRGGPPRRRAAAPRRPGRHDPAPARGRRGPARRGVAVPVPVVGAPHRRHLRAAGGGGRRPRGPARPDSLRRARTPTTERRRAGAGIAVRRGLLRRWCPCGTEPADAAQSGTPGPAYRVLPVGQPAAA